MTHVNNQPPAQTNGAVAKKELNIVESTLQRINEMQGAGELKIPKDYSAPNALKSAWLILQDVKDFNKNPALQVCSKESVAYALLNMVVQGLNPMKRQCSFIVYGSKLTLQREYQGSITIAKRAGLKSVIANAVFDGDDFAFEVDVETGRRKVTKHVPNFDSFGGKVKGAYAMIEMEDGTKNVEIMSMPQIEKAWQQGPTKGQSPAHKNFPDQMACKTVINRALKTIINSSDDAALFEEDEPTENVFTAAVKHEIATKANADEIGFEEEVNLPNSADTNNHPADEDGVAIEATKQAEPSAEIKPGTQTKAPF